MSWPAVKKLFTHEEFLAYCLDKKDEMGWHPDKIVIHNTAAPNLAQYAKSGGIKRMESLESYYKGKGWSGGPHLFVAPEGIYVFNPLTSKGVHSPSWNSSGFGIEMIGDYDRDAFDSGDGLKVQNHAVEAAAILAFVFGIQTSDIKFHKEDPKTTHACPGKKVLKAPLIAKIKARKIELMEAA